MKIILESITENYDGLIDVSIILTKDDFQKSYSYTIKSKKIIQDCEKLCRKRKYGAALNLLKNNDVSIEKEKT